MSKDESDFGVTSFSELLTCYFRELDAAMALLSNGMEADLAYASPISVSQRLIKLGISPDGSSYALRVDPNQDTDEDTILVETLRSKNDLDKLLYPSIVNFSFDTIPSNGSIMMSDMQLSPVGQPLADHILHDPGLVAVGPASDLPKLFSVESARSDAINYWNIATTRSDNSSSFPHTLRQIFAKFSAIVKQKAYLERRVHRFIEGHSKFLLPDHLESLSEVELHGDAEVRRADLILRRGSEAPALLIELESPVHRLVTKNGDWSKEVNHARRQIADWTRLINDFPHLNANPDNARGDMTFLRGRKDRLVVIGRGADPFASGRRSADEDITVWTYDVLLREAKTRWTENMRHQCKLLAGFKP